ncbi:hypothetical protein ACWDZ8_40995 [Streptomyces sp. NPDC003233]
MIAPHSSASPALARTVRKRSSRPPGSAPAMAGLEEGASGGRDGRRAA